jgi:integrase
MASISSDPRGNRAVQFMAADGKRRTVRLGKMPLKQVESVKLRIEALNSAKIAGHPLDSDAAAWLAKIGDDLHGRLAAVGLVVGRNVALLGSFTQQYIESRRHLKPNTICNLRVCARRMVEHFGKDRPMHTITPADADAFAIALKTEETKTTKKKYAPATAARTIGRVKEFFHAAIRAKHLHENPFEDVKRGKETNPARQFYVDRDTITKVLEAAPDHEWRLIIALSRYGGLRCPSEVLTLEWADVNWEKDRFLVHSAKTEHHEGDGERWVPIFAELRPYLEESFECAKDGATFVITRYRDTRANLRTQFLRILKRAGVKRWEKVIQNLRASCETDLTQTFPIHVVCRWLGNTTTVAMKHYLQSMETDFQRAANSGAVNPGALQNPVQHRAAPVRTGSQQSTQEQLICGDMRDGASVCGSTQNYLAPRLGLEPRT